MTSVPGDPRQCQHIRATIAPDHTRLGSDGAGEPRLRRQHRFALAGRLRIAERKRQMRHGPAKSRLGHLPPHRHFAACIGRRQRGQRRIVHRGSADRCQGIRRQPAHVIPVHRGSPRCCGRVDRITCAKVMHRLHELRWCKLPHPAGKKNVKIVLVVDVDDVEVPLAAIDHETDTIMPGNHLFKRQPPHLRNAIGNPGRHIDRKRGLVPRQHRIGKRDDIPVAAIECQARETSGWRGRSGAADSLLDRHDLEPPAPQCKKQPVEHLRRHLAGFQGLEAVAPSRADPLQAQDGPEAAPTRFEDACGTAKVGKLQCQPLRRAVSPRHDKYPINALQPRSRAPLSLPFVDISLQRSSSSKNTDYPTGCRSSYALGCSDGKRRQAGGNGD